MGQLARRYRKALVTGPSSGLGRAFTEMLLGEGISVVGLSRRPELAGANDSYFPIVCDLSNQTSVAKTLDEVFVQHPDLDLVMNNAGFGLLSELPKMSDAQIEAQYAVMLVAPTLIAKRALQAFQETGVSGCVVNVSSLAAELPIPLMPVYNACKAGLSGLSESLNLDVSGLPSKTVVMDFRPGDFCTPFADRMEEETDWSGVDLRAVMARHHAEAPPVELAVAGLRRALLRGRPGRVRVGHFFQARVAPLGPKLLPPAWLRALIRLYYKN